MYPMIMMVYKPMDKNFFALLVCPNCKGKLVWNKEKHELICKLDLLAFPIRDDIPVMLIDEARALTPSEVEAC